MSFKTKFVGVFGAAILTFSAVVGVAAQEPTAGVPVSVEVKGNTLPLSVSLTSTGFTAVDYSLATDKKTSGTFTMAVSDPRGTGEGWNVKINATGDFRDEGGNNSFALDSNLVLGDGTLTGVTGTVTKTPVTMTKEQQPILSAAAKSGMGTVTYSIPADVNVPKGTLVGNYKTTLNVSIASGPS